MPKYCLLSIYMVYFQVFYYISLDSAFVKAMLFLQGFDLWQRHSSGISHMDSDETDSKSSPEEIQRCSKGDVNPPVLTNFSHPPSNFAHQTDHIRGPVWQYSALNAYKPDQ